MTLETPAPAALSAGRGKSRARKSRARKSHSRRRRMHGGQEVAMQGGTVPVVIIPLEEIAAQMQADAQLQGGRRRRRSPKMRRSRTVRRSRRHSRRV